MKPAVIIEFKPKRKVRGTPWTAEQIESLLAMNAKRIPHHEIARRLNRPHKAITQKLSVLRRPPKSKPCVPKSMERPSEVNVIALAEDELGTRITKFKGIRFLDGKQCTIPTLLREANLSLMACGKKPLCRAPELLS